MGEPNELTYPRTWTYSMIGRDEAELRAAADEVLADRPYLLEAGRESGKGKYVSLRMEVRVEDQADRDAIFARLSEHDAVTIVI